MRVALLTLSICISLLAPMPPGIAYNPETKECGYYMGGDEYVSYVMPGTWVINYGEVIQDETGSHQWDGDSASIEAFCTELGYTYVEGNMAQLSGQARHSPVYYSQLICKTAPFLLLIVVILVVVLVITKKKRKKIPLPTA